MFPQACPNDKREPAPPSPPDGEPTANELIDMFHERVRTLVRERDRWEAQSPPAVRHNALFEKLEAEIRHWRWLESSLPALLALRVERDEATQQVKILLGEHELLRASINKLRAENAELKTRLGRFEANASTKCRNCGRPLGLHSGALTECVGFEPVRP